MRENSEWLTTLGPVSKVISSRLNFPKEYSFSPRLGLLAVQSLALLTRKSFAFKI
jgi:hypothetical protein